MSIGQWAFLAVMSLLAAGTIAIGVSIWMDGARLFATTVVVAGIVVFGIVFAYPSEFNKTNTRKERCEANGDYWYDPPRADGICLAKEAVKG